jgi:hypothetical protein
VWNSRRWCKLRRKAALLLSIIVFAGLSSATVTSADSITFNSNNEFFNGEVFAISVASDESTDKIDIFLDRNELSESTDGEVQQDLQIDFTDQSTELRYSTTPSSDLVNIYTFTPYNEQGFSSSSEAVSAIKSNCFDLNGNGEGSGVYNYETSSTSYEIYCYTQDKYLGTPTFLDNPDEIFSTTATLQASGKTRQSATLSNGDTGSGVITDLGSHAKIRWNGNMDTGASTPDNTRIYALHANRYSGSWRVIGETAYDDYSTYLEGGQAFQALEDWAFDSAPDITGWEAVDRLNSRAWDAAEVDETSELAYTTVTDNSFSNGQFTFDTEDLLVYPTFTVYVDAGENGYIEISKPTGEPKIVSTTSTTIPENGTGSISATVENVGEGEGSFSGRLTGCSDGFVFSDTQTTEDQVFPGTTVSYSFDVSFQSTSSEQRDIDGTCTVQVQDTGSGVSDSTSISVTGRQVSNCGELEAGDEKRSQGADGKWDIYVCKDNEQGFRHRKECAEGKKPIAQGDDTFACEEEPDPPCEGSNCPPPPCKDGDCLPPWISNFLSQLHLGFSILAGILLGVVGYKGGRWIDGESRVKGGFEPFKSRSISRVKKGRFLVGAVGAVAGFVLGTLVALQVPLGVQVIVVLGVGALLWKNPFNG